MNSDVKGLIKNRGLCQWEIADYLGISETTFCRKMRRPLDPEFRECILQAIKDIVQAKAAAKIQSAGSRFVVEK